MNNQILTGQTVALTIQSASYPYAADTLGVNQGEIYQFNCDAGQQWKDWYITTTPDGYTNIFAFFSSGMRVKGTKCFCLCGAYNNNDSTGFAIGSAKTVTIAQAGTLSFFANDVVGHYGNNKGEIMVNITRLQ